MAYSSPIVIIFNDLNYSDNDYVILLKFKYTYWIYSHPEATNNVCIYTLEKLNKEGILYGFNVNNSEIVKRNKKGMNDPINIKNTCHNYLDNKENTLYIAFTVK